MIFWINLAVIMKYILIKMPQFIYNRLFSSKMAKFKFWNLETNFFSPRSLPGLRKNTVMKSYNFMMRPRKFYFDKILGIFVHQGVLQQLSMGILSMKIVVQGRRVLLCNKETKRLKVKEINFWWGKFLLKKTKVFGQLIA